MNKGWGCLKIGCWGRYVALKGKKVTGDWRKLRNDELYDLYSSPNDLSNRASIIIRSYIDHMKFATYMPCFVYHILSWSFGSILCRCIYGCMFCMLLYNFVNYIFLLPCLCSLIVMYASFWPFCFTVLFCVLFVCKCVLYCTVLLPPGVNSTAVNKYIISYCIISYNAIYHISNITWVIN